MVRFDNVSKRYGALTVLDGLDLEMKRGEKVSVIGPSGSGKTTVLRMLMTLETINDGVIWVEGEPLTHMERNGKLVPADLAHIRKIRAKIGMVFQSFNLFPHMTAMANCIEAPITVLGMKRAEAEARAAELLDMVGLVAEEGPLSFAAVRRPAAARRHRPRARHAAQNHAVRRGDVGARSRTRRRSAGGYPQTGQGA